FVTPGGKIVYGGGGIMPDVFVPLDTTGASEYYNKIRSLGLMYRFAFYYTDIHRSSLDQFSTARDIEGYLDDQDLLPQFIKYASGKGVPPDYKDIRISELVLQKTIKAYVARNIIDNDGFYPIIADIDETLKVAIDTIATL
ncbi:MAG: peptidase S41, partial [Bacteroidales bacterium]|nr:peptidase S41 [Bacteroidales bacterium]